MILILLSASITLPSHRDSVTAKYSNLNSIFYYRMLSHSFLLSSKQQDIMDHSAHCPPGVSNKQKELLKEMLKLWCASQKTTT